MNAGSLDYSALTHISRLETACFWRSAQTPRLPPRTSVALTPPFKPKYIFDLPITGVCSHLFETTGLDAPSG